MEYTASPSLRTERTLAMTLALKPPQSDELEAMAMTARGASSTRSAVFVHESPPAEARMRCSCRSYGRMFSMAVCAFRSLAEDTSFIAEVIFSVFFTDAIRPFISFNVGIPILR